MEVSIIVLLYLNMLELVALFFVIVLEIVNSNAVEIGNFL